VRGATTGTVVDTHEAIKATRPVNLHAVDVGGDDDGSALTAPPATSVSDASEEVRP
jgi:hypothetical protein